jgi:hypothetical protein
MRTAIPIGRYRLPSAVARDPDHARFGRLARWARRVVPPMCLAGLERAPVPDRRRSAQAVHDRRL